MSRALAIGLALGLCCMGQTCAKHVRLHNYYNTSSQPMAWEPAFAQAPPTGVCGPTPIVKLWFDKVPEWLNGDATMASAMGGPGTGLTATLDDVSVPVLPGASFQAFGFVGNTGMAYDAFFWNFCVQGTGVTVCVTPSNAVWKPQGRYDILYLHPGCLDQATAVAPLPTNDNRTAQDELAFFVPRFSNDQLDPCEWVCDTPGCGPDGLTQSCVGGDPVHDPNGGAFCQAPTPWPNLYISGCCSCQPG